MRKFLLLLLLIALTAFALPVQAQGTWECHYDFTVSQAGWTILDNTTTPLGWNAVWTEGIGFEDADYFYTPPPWRRSVDIGLLDLPAMDDIELSVTYSVSGGNDILMRFYDYDTIVASSTSSGNITLSSSAFDVTEGQYIHVYLAVDAQSSPGSHSGTGVIESATISGNGTNVLCPPEPYTKPYSTSEEHAWGLFNNSNAINPYGIFAISKQPGAHVSAAVDGTVDLVRRASIGDCTVFIGTVFLTPCTLNIPAVVNGTSNDFLHGLTGVNPGVTGDITPWLVRIVSENTYFFYFVENADKYVSEGQTVTAGCWLGESMRLTTAGGNIENILQLEGDPVNRGYADYGMTIITVVENGTRVDALPNFVENPSVNAPCNLPEGFEGCQGDSSLTTPGQWTDQGVTWRESGGLTLSPGGYIRTQMNLDPTREPGLKVGARAIGSNTTLALKLGQAAQSIPLTVGSGFTKLTIEPDEYDPDGDFYTIEIRNAGSGSAELNYVCVYHSLDEDSNPIEVPDGPAGTPNDNNALCKFTDYSFDAPSAWTLSSGETATGEIRIPAGATVSQSVNVLAGTYTLSVVASVWHYSAFTPDDTDTDTITFEYDYPADTSYTTISAKTFGQYAENNNVMVHSTSLVLGSDTSGSFVFRAVLSDTPTNVRGVIVRSICIGSGETGQSGSGTGGSDWEGPFETSCTAISTPTGSSAIGTWARWFWAKLNGFFQCELMIILNSIYTAINRIVLTLGWAMRYNIAVTTGAWDWAGDALFPWFAGYMSNIQPAVVRGPVNEQCGNIFCGIINVLQILQEVLERFFGPIFDFFLSLVNLVVDIVFLVLNGLLTLLFLFLELVVGLLVRAILLMTDIIVQWNNAPPQALPGLPDCLNAPETSTCGVFWTLENTVLATGTPGELIVPLFVSFLHIITAISLVRRFMKMAASAGDSLG